MKNIEKLRGQTAFWLILLFIIAWTVLLFNYTPQEIVEVLGVNNTYLVGFVVSVLGAFSSLTTFSTYPAIITLAAGQVNPFLLGAVAGVGLAIGDTFFFFFGLTARGVVSKKFKRRLEVIIRWLKRRSQLFLHFFIFIYVGFTPFPNNVLTGLLALSDYPFKKLAPPLFLGDMLLPILVAYLSYQGVDLLINNE